jgi:hypothetical protein
MTELLLFSRRERSAIAVAATLATGTLGACVLALFHHAGPELWLAPSQQVMESAAHCDALRERKPREQCLKQLVAVRTGKLVLPQQMAATGQGQALAR